MTPEELTIAWTEGGTRYEVELTQLSGDQWALVKWAGTGDDRRLVGALDVTDVSVRDGQTGVTYIGP